MKIECIRIDGFGRLIDRSYELCPGINVFFGPNESGKSTLQLAFLALLYGYHAGPGRARKGETALLERFSPWRDGVPYRGSLEYRLSDQSHYRADRDFAKRTTQLWDMARGAEVSSDYAQGNNGYVGFAKDQLGLSKDLFCSTAYISQGSTSELGDGREIAAALRALLSTGTTDTTVERARKQLADASEKVSTPGSRVRPMDKARSALKELEHEKRIVVDAHEAISEWAEECEEAEREKSELQLRLDALDLARLETEHTQICQRIERHAQLQNQLAQAVAQRTVLAEFSHFRADKQSDVQRLMDRAEAYRDDVIKLEADVTNEAVKRAETEAESANTRKRLSVLSKLPPRRRELCEQIDVTAQARGRAEERLATHDQRRPEALAELRRIGATLAEDCEIVRLVRACNTSDFAALVAEQARNRRDLEAEERALSDAQGDLEQAGLTPEQAQEMVSLREQITPELERQIRARAETLVRLEERIEARRGAPAVEPRAPVRFPAVPLVVGMIVALGAGLLGTLLTSIQLGLLVMLFLSLVWSGGVTVWWLARRDGDAESTVSSTLQEMEQEYAALSKAQTEGVRASGFDSWQSLSRALDESAAVTTYLHALQMARRRLVDAQEAYGNTKGDIDLLLAEAGISSWTAGSLEELRTEMATIESLLRDLRQAARALQQLRIGREPLAQTLDETQCKLEDLLSRLDIQEGTIPERLASYRRLIEQWDEQDRCEQQLSLLEERLAGYNERAQRLDSVQQDLATAEDGLVSLLKSCDIETERGSSLQDACEEFYERAEARREYDHYAAAEQNLLSQIESLLSGDSRDQLESRRVEQEERMQTIKHRRPGLSCETLGLTNMASREDIEAQCQKLDRQVTQLSERMAGALKDLRPLAAVEEDIIYQRATIDELEAYQRCLGIADEILAEAANEYQVAFSPRIKKSLDEHVSLLTAGRYNRVMVGAEDLAMTVEVPETRKLLEPQVLSYGTKEQLYMLLRLAIAEILTDGDESIPLILDDPFVNYDDARLDRMLELLEHVSEAHQVILFTMETRIRDWAESSKSTAEVCCMS